MLYYLRDILSLIGTLLICTLPSIREGNVIYFQPHNFSQEAFQHLIAKCSGESACGIPLKQLFQEPVPRDCESVVLRDAQRPQFFKTTFVILGQAPTDGTLKNTGRSICPLRKS